MRLTDYLKEHFLIADGAMETYYTSQFHCDSKVELESLTHPERIEEIHKEYIKNGARLIRTNTFSLSTSAGMHQASQKTCIEVSCNIAKRAYKQCVADGTLTADEPFFIAASIGPIYANQNFSSEDVLDEYKEICHHFLDAGVDIFVFETHSNWTYLSQLIPYLKEIADVTIMVNFALNHSGYTNDGLHLNSLLSEAHKFRDKGLDIFGLNCSISASHMYNFLHKADLTNLPLLCVMPNSGYPTVQRGKAIYPFQPEYFAKHMEKLTQLGVRLLGGCCGTTPKYIKYLKQIISTLTPVNPKNNAKTIPVVSSSSHTTKNGETYNANTAIRNADIHSTDIQNIDIHSANIDTNDILFGKMQAFRKKLYDPHEKPFVVELDPPFNADAGKLLTNAKKLASSKVDILTLSDSPLGRPRADATHLAVKIQNDYTLPVLPHISCRDKNVIAMRGTLLGMHIQGIRNALIVTGDPVPVADRGRISSVYDFNSIRLMEYVKQLNSELTENEPFFYGGALNYHGVNKQAIAKRMFKKMEQGCSFFLTQPVYSKEDIERLAWLKQETNAIILGGIMPLVSYKNAQFIKNEMPGIHVPEEIIEQYKEGLTKEEYEEIAVNICTDIGKSMADVVDGYYLMTPFNRVDLIMKIMEQMC